MAKIHHTVPLEDRLNFYLNFPRESEQVNISSEVYQGSRRMYKEHKAVFQYEKYKSSFLEWYCLNLIHKNPFNKIRSLPGYRQYSNLLTLSDFLKLFQFSSGKIRNKNFLLYHGEQVLSENLPYIRKARKIKDKHSVLFKLGTIRHFFPCKTAMKHDIEWKRKKENVIWRGATTNEKFRSTFVKKYFDLFDVGFSSVVQRPYLSLYRKDTVSIRKQLTHKYIVSLEGCDLASNLKWILSSNSVPVMPKPTWVSWIMEHKLVPYVHYLPLNDELDNLEELLDWAKANDDACAEIALNGKRYMMQFWNEKKENQIQQQLLSRYTNLFKLLAG